MINPETFKPDFEIREELEDLGDQILRFTHSPDQEDFLTVDAYKTRGQFTAFNWGSSLTKDEALQVFRDLADIEDIASRIDKVTIGPTSWGIEEHVVESLDQYREMLEDKELFADAFLVRADLSGEPIGSLVWESGEVPDLGPAGFGILSSRLLDEEWHHGVLEKSALEQSKLLVAKYGGQLIAATNFFFDQRPGYSSLTTGFSRRVQ